MDDQQPTLPPPAYDTLESPTFTKPLTLKLCKPLLNTSTRKVNAGKSIEEATDAISLSRTLKYRDLAKCLSSKIDVRFNGRVSQAPGRFKWTIVAVCEADRRRMIPFTVENVAAVVELLRDSAWGLEVKFTEVPGGMMQVGTAMRVRGCWKRMWDWYREPSCGLCRIERAAKEERCR